MAVEPGRSASRYSCNYEFVLFDTLNRFYVDRNQPAVLAMPRERAAWDAATHMYEIGKAPENAAHPDHDLALELTRSFWAALPRLDEAVLTELLAWSRLPPGAPLADLRREAAIAALQWCPRPNSLRL
jgi:hypothetical protein